jgi:hypothetical protein
MKGDYEYAQDFKKFHPEGFGIGDFCSSLCCDIRVDGADNSGIYV